MKNEKKFTISHQIWILSGIFSVLLFVVGGLGLFNAIRLSNQFEKVMNVYLKLTNDTILLDMYHDGLAAKVYKSLWFSNQGMTKEALAVKEETKEMIEKIKLTTDELSKLGISESARQKLKDSMDPFAQYVNVTTEIVNLAVSENGYAKAVSKTGDFEKAFEYLEKSLGQLGESLEGEAKIFFDESDQLSKFAKYLEFAVLVLGNGLGLFIAWYFVRGIYAKTAQIAADLNNGSTKVNLAAQSISDSANSLAESTTELASAIEQTASSMEEMSAMIGQTTQSAGQTNHQAQGSIADATHGKEVIGKMVHSMRDIAESTERLLSIAKVIDDIKNKTKVINDIAFETRLLAFNASIEAARAGAHGRGFAVVAEEVGKLADVSGKAAEEVRQLLEQSVSQVGSIIENTNKKIEEGEKTTQECQQAFVKMQESIENITQGISRISSAAQEQEAGVKQTNRAIGEMEKVTQINSQSAEKLSSNAESLRGSSLELMESAKGMQILVFGKSSADSNDSIGGNSGGNSRKMNQGSETNDQSNVVSLGDIKHRSGEEGKKFKDPSVLANTVKEDVKDREDGVERNDSRWHAA